MSRFIKRYQLWIAYALFLVAAYVFGSREGLVGTQGTHAVGKYLILVAYIAFLAFSLYATHRENFFRSIGKINALLWGRQVGIDLYISMGLSLALIYLVEGSHLVLMLWLIPVLVFANLAVLPYILLNFGEIMGHFQG